jgi:hypothetical protein
MAAFLSRITISASPALDPANPFTAPFVISNDGILSVHPVKYSCYLNNLVSAQDIRFAGIALINWTSVRTRRRPGKRDTLFVRSVFRLGLRIFRWGFLFDQVFLSDTASTNIASSL